MTTTSILLLVSAIIILRQSYMAYKTNKQIEEFKNEKNKEIEILKYKILIWNKRASEKFRY